MYFHSKGTVISSWKRQTFCKFSWLKVVVLTKCNQIVMFVFWFTEKYCLMNTLIATINHFQKTDRVVSIGAVRRMNVKRLWMRAKQLNLIMRTTMPASVLQDQLKTKHTQLKQNPPYFHRARNAQFMTRLLHFLWHLLRFFVCCSFSFRIHWVFILTRILYCYIQLNIHTEKDTIEEDLSEKNMM